MQLISNQKKRRMQDLVPFVGLSKWVFSNRGGKGEGTERIQFLFGSIRTPLNPIQKSLLVTEGTNQFEKYWVISNNSNNNNNISC